MSRAEITTPEVLSDESVVELSLRPQRLAEFIGQQKVKDNLRLAIDAALARSEPLDHAIFYGPPGLGKTTLAELIARELRVNIRTTSGPALEKPGDLVGTLTNLRAGDILFIDEIHRLRPVIEEFLYPAMEDYRIDIRLSEGPKAQTITMPIERFTLIGATTRFGMLTAPMRARFGIEQRLNYYAPEDLELIVRRTAEVLKVEIESTGAREIACRSRGTPRVANRLLRRVRDYAQVRADGVITEDVARAALAMLDVDQFGLDDMDARILRAIIEKFEGGPVGVATISAAIGEDASTLEEVYEPFLVQQGFSSDPRRAARTSWGQSKWGQSKRGQSCLSLTPFTLTPATLFVPSTAVCRSDRERYASLPGAPMPVQVPGTRYPVLGVVVQTSAPA
ncbi:MAG: Holliday junction branch migration DNA helicase RuvB [Gemmatimonadetes bacterium]|nr:Holliday junction branch migration DNA helicase RuvB [Gemmatimonadota bacterium]